MIDGKCFRKLEADDFPLKDFITIEKLRVFEVPGSPVMKSGILFKIQTAIQKQFSLRALFFEMSYSSKFNYSTK